MQYDDVPNRTWPPGADDTGGALEPGPNPAKKLPENSYQNSNAPRQCGDDARSELFGLRAALESSDGSLQDLTVLAVQNDPFRVDTPAGHRDGKWLATKLVELDVKRQRHLRGLHYILLGQLKPDGEPYTNTDADWNWLGRAAKAARWLGYIEFGRIVDERNEEPEVWEWAPPEPQPFVSQPFVDTDNLHIHVPDADGLAPRAGVADFVGTQPYHLVLVGEKSSLREVLGRAAQRNHADLYVMTGEMSDTRIHRIAQSAMDGRPLVVLYFADCDPAGWQMGISLSRKLQAFKHSLFPQLEFQVHRAALIPDQVRLYGLPSTPLKDTERRADKWFKEMGVEQTEVDALAALQPRLLAEITDAAVVPFFDTTLDERVRLAEVQWRERAQAVIDEHVGEEHAQLRADAARRLAAKRDKITDIADEIHDILESVRVDVDDVDLPEPAVPEAAIDIEPPLPLCDSQWSFSNQCALLIASKAYRPVHFKGKRVTP
jgi:hypothetical protein